MIEVLPLPPDPVVDVVQDDEGFSAELSVERPLPPGELAAFEDAIARLRPVVRVDGARRMRAIATVDDDALWISVHCVGPGRYDDRPGQEARALAADLWTAVHTAASAS
jgi:hypothetical protein